MIADMTSQSSTGSGEPAVIFADPALESRASRRFGPVAVGAALLAVIAGPAKVTVADFRLAFFLIGLIPLVAAFGFLRLTPGDGAAVSGHVQPQRRAA